MALTSNQKGNATEALFLAYCVSNGLTVSTPFGGNARYDYILDFEGRLLKIQVKTCKISGDKTYIQFSCSSSHFQKKQHRNTKYTKSEIDYFATFYKDEVYLVPVEECSRSKKLRLETAKNKQKKCVNLATDYLMFKVLGELR